MPTTIHSNGSKWMGEEPDTIEKLIEVLGQYALNRDFEGFGNFIQRGETIKEVRFFGNFLELSHVFRIDTDDKDVIDKLTKAIEENKRRPDYKAQPTHEEQERERNKRRMFQLRELKKRGR